MRSIHFSVSDGMHTLIQQRSEDVGASVAHFCREPAIARAVLWEARRGYNSTDPEVWDQITDQIRQIETHDAKHREDSDLRLGRACLSQAGHAARDPGPAPPRDGGRR